MIGDDIESDVGGAQACGLRGIQVRTGKFRLEIFFDKIFKWEIFWSTRKFISSLQKHQMKDTNAIESI